MLIRLLALAAFVAGLAAPPLVHLWLMRHRPPAPPDPCVVFARGAPQPVVTRIRCGDDPQFLDEVRTDAKSRAILAKAIVRSRRSYQPRERRPVQKVALIPLWYVEVTFDNGSHILMWIQDRLEVRPCGGRVLKTGIMEDALREVLRRERTLGGR